MEQETATETTEDVADAPKQIKKEKVTIDRIIYIINY